MLVGPLRQAEKLHYHAPIRALVIHSLFLLLSMDFCFPIGSVTLPLALISFCWSVGWSVVGRFLKGRAIAKLHCQVPFGALVKLVYSLFLLSMGFCFLIIVYSICQGKQRQRWEFIKERFQEKRQKTRS